MSIADPYSFTKQASSQHFQAVGFGHGYFENPYRMFAYASIASEAPKMTALRGYPIYISIASYLIVIGTTVSGLMSYFWPGPIVGLSMPVFVTFWWIMYRLIIRYERQQHA